MFFWWCNIGTECAQVLPMCVRERANEAIPFNISMHVSTWVTSHRRSTKWRFSTFAHYRPDPVDSHLCHILPFATSFRILNLWPAERCGCMPSTDHTLPHHYEWAIVPVASHAAQKIILFVAAIVHSPERQRNKPLDEKRRITKDWIDPEKVATDI